MQNKRLFFVLALILLFAGCKFVQFPKVEADYGWTKLADTPAPVGPGSSLVSFIDNSHNSHIYATRGENTTDFWSYNTDTNTWTVLAPTPGPVGPGSSMVYTVVPSDHVIFALQGGNTTGFWQYNLNNNTWSILQNTPAPVGPGGSITRAQNYDLTMVLRGSGTSDFWGYDSGLKLWTTLASTPGPVGYGGGLAGIELGTNPQGNFVGALQGNGNSGFWFYDADSNLWSIRNNVPAPVGLGEGLSTIGDGSGGFTVFAGGNSRQVWCITDAISSNGTWTRQADFPTNLNDGSAITTLFPPFTFSLGYTFVLQGSNTTGFYKDTTLCDPSTTKQNHTFVFLRFNQTSVNIGGTINYSANVVDSTYLINPRGNFSLSDGGAGGTFNFDSCNIVFSNDLTCIGTYTAPTSAKGVTINATYIPSDSVFLPSHSTSLLTVLDPNSSSGLFCGKPLNSYAQVFNGTSQNEFIVGTNANDLIMGNGGNDTILGLGGDDCILGGAGNDTINGGPGNDYIDGGTGDDKIIGDSGNDTIFGSNGNDIIDGGAGEDKIYGGAGNDTINGSDGNDYINGGDGDDKIYAGAGNDEIHAMDGNDYINAGDGDDKIYAGAGDDEIHGGAGNDYINGGDGIDKCFDTLGNNTKINCEQ